MKYFLTQNQIKMVSEAIDISLKSGGINALASAVETVNMINQPTQQTEEGNFYKLTESQIEHLGNLLDITLKSVGLNGAAQVMGLAELLRNPLPEDEEEEQEQEADSTDKE